MTHPSIFEDLKEICEDAFTGVWIGSTDSNTEDDYWSDFEAIDQGLAVLDTMRALFGDETVARAIRSGREDSIEKYMDEDDSCDCCDHWDDCFCCWKGYTNEPTDEIDLDFDLDFDNLDEEDYLGGSQENKS